MTPLQALINVLITQYFNNSLCISYIFDQVTISNNYIVLNNIPIFNLNLSETSAISKLPRCNELFISVRNSSKVIQTIENYIQKNSSYIYNRRRYLIVLHQEDVIPFNLKEFTFIDKVLLIKKGHFDDYNETVFELYNHNYEITRGNNKEVLLNKWFNNNQSFLLNHVNLYPERVLKQKGRKFVNGIMNNPPYVDITEDYQLGSEYKTMLEFAKHCNMTFVPIMFDVWGDFNEDWNATSDSVKLAHLEDVIDVYYSSAVLTRKSLKYASVSYPLMRISYKCLVPEPREKNDWLLAVNIKNFKFWLLYFFVNLSFSFLIFQRRKHSLIKWNFSQLDFYGMCLCQGISDQNIPRDRFMRILFIELLLSTIIFTTIYNSHLSSIITIPIFADKIDTINDMTQQHLKWTAPTDGYAVPFQDYNPKLYNSFFLSSYDQILELLRKRTHIGFAFIELTSRYYDLKNVNIPEIEYYDVLKDDFIVEFTYFHLRKNSVLLERLNEFILTIKESGLSIYWETENYFARNLLLSHSRLKDNEESILRPLTIDKVKSHFVIWVIGICIALICFTYEIYCFKRKLPVKRNHYLSEVITK